MPRKNDAPLPPNPWREIEDAYYELLERLYEKQQRTKAYPVALHLSRLLAEHDPKCEALLGMRGRCLLAELDGDTDAAVRYRRMEVAAVKQLLDSFTPDQMEWTKMGPDDYSDALDLLALNYLDAGRYAEALATLEESESYCKLHGIPFDGKDIRADVKRAMRRKRPATAKTA